MSLKKEDKKFILLETQLRLQNPIFKTLKSLKTPIERFELINLND